MNKLQLYNLVVSKFSKVQSMSDWEFIGKPTLGISKYNIQVYLEGKGVETYSVIVENEGTPEEEAYIPGLSLVDQPITLTFEQRSVDFIKARKVDGTIVDAIPSIRGDKCTEYFVYRLVNAVLVKELYLLNLDSKDNLTFRKIS